MANTFFKTKDVDGTIRNVDVFGLDDGDYRTAIVVGDPDSAAGAAPVSAALGMRVNEAKSSTSTLANVTAATSSTTLRAAETARRAVIIVNDSTAVCYVKYGTGASSTSYTYLMQPGEALREERYTGIITGIWVSVNGAARVTELT
jgi:hypothetical protein